MIKAVISRRVPVEKQDEYLKFIREELKPFQEAHGCRAYNIFREVARNNKDIIKPEELVTEALFDDVAAIEKFRGLFDKEPLKSMMKRLFAFEEINHTHYISVV